MPDTVPLDTPAVEYAERSDPGRDPEKQVNEDASGGRETTFGYLSVVCDGMGGHEGGREASSLALKTILDAFEHAAPRPDLPPAVRGRELLKEAITQANRRVFELAGAGVVGRPGSTVVAVLMHPVGTEVAHVGDSRCYLVHQGQIAQITKDHSMVQQLVDANVLTPQQAAAHPDANKITRALGMQAEVEVEVRPTSIPHVAGDVFVLCSDGLSDLVAQGDILKIAAAAPAAQAAGQLVDLANARGGHDNVTVAVLRTRASALTAREPLQSTASGTSPSQRGSLQTEAMPQRTVISTPVLPTGPASSPSAPRVSTTSDYRVSASPSDIVRVRRRVPTVVILAVLLGAVGVAVGAAALWLVIPHPKKTMVPFAISVIPPGRAAPTASIAPLTPEVLPPAESAAPLPSLVPTPRRKANR